MALAPARAGGAAVSLGFAGWLLALGAPLGLGALVLAALGVRPRGETFAWPARAWCLGALLLGGVVAGPVLLGRVPGLFLWVPVLLAAAAVLSVLAVRARRVEAREDRDDLDRLVAPRTPRPNSARLAIAVLLVASIPLADRAVTSFARPLVVGVDGAARDARLVFEAGGLGEAYRDDAARLAAVAPGGAPAFAAPLEALLELWIFAVADRATWFENRAPAALFAWFLPLLVAAAAWPRARPWIAVIPAVLLTGAAPLHAELAGAGSAAAVAAGLVLAVDGWWRWRAGGGDGWFALSMLGVALCVAARQEGLVAAAAFAAGAAADLVRDVRERRRARAVGRTAAAPRRRWPPAIWVAAPLVALAAGALLSGRAAEGAHALASFTPLRFAARFASDEPRVLAPLVDWVLLVPSHGRLVPLALLLVVVARPRAAWRGPTMATLVTVVAGVLFVYAWLVAASAGSDHALRTSAARELFVFVPVAGVALAALLEDAWTAWRRARDA